MDKGGRDRIISRSVSTLAGDDSKILEMPAINCKMSWEQVKRRLDQHMPSLLGRPSPEDVLIWVRLLYFDFIYFSFSADSRHVKASECDLGSFAKHGRPRKGECSIAFATGAPSSERAHMLSRTNKPPGNSCFLVVVDAVFSN